MIFFYSKNSTHDFFLHFIYSLQINHYVVIKLKYYETDKKKKKKEEEYYSLIVCYLVNFYFFLPF